MDNKKIEDILKSSKQKVEIDNEHKEGLRRELLNSNKFGKQPGWLTKNKMIFAVSLSIAVLLIIFNPGFEEKQISAAEIVDKVKENYAGFNIADQLNIVNSDLKIYGLDNEEIELNVVRKINFSKSQQRLTLLMNTSNEVLDDYIIANNDIYRTSNPKIEFNFNLPEDELSKVVTSFNYSYSTDTTSTTKVFIKDIQNCESYIIYKSNSFNTELGTVQEHKFKVDSEVSIEKYLRDNPVKIANDLKHDKIKMLRVNKENNLVVIELEKDIEPKEYKLFLKGFEREDDGKGKVSSNKFLFEFNHLDIDSLVKAEIETKNVSKLQSITINSESGDIIHVKYQINRDGEIRQLSEQSFTTIKEKEYTGNEFDFEGNGFVFSYKIK